MQVVGSKIQEKIRGNAADQIFETVRDEILAGKWPRGTKLPTEKEFCVTYGVSGVTIRAAMRSLAAARLITVKHGSGSYVTAESGQLLAASLRSLIQVDRITASEILTVLGGMNGFAAELAAVNASAEDLQIMQRELTRMEVGESIEEISKGLQGFLDQLALSSGSSMLASFCKVLSGLQIGLAWELSDGTLKGWQTLTGSFAPQRNAILTALNRRNPQSARAATMAYHSSTRDLITSLPRKTRVRLDSIVTNLLSAWLAQ